MSQFLYYFSGVQPPVTAKRILDVGLSDRLETFYPRKCHTNTPDGRSGYVVAVSASHAVMDLASQTWRPAPKGDLDSPPYWVGYNTAEPPGPESLARTPLLDGKKMRLTGGDKWQVPVIRNWYDGDDEHAAVYVPKLPQMLDINDDGKAVPGDIVPAYRGIWDEAMEIHTKVYNQAVVEGVGTLTNEEVFAFAAKCIGANYRVSLLELAMLSAMSTKDCVDVIRVALDSEGFEQARKNFWGRSTLEDIDSDSGLTPQTEEPPTPTDQA